MRGAGGDQAAEDRRCREAMELGLEGRPAYARSGVISHAVADYPAIDGDFYKISMASKTNLHQLFLVNISNNVLFYFEYYL